MTAVVHDHEQAPPVEQQLALDMVKRGVWVAPLLLVAAAVGWGWAGVASSGFALGLVFANFLLAAAMLGWAAKKSPAVLMATAFGGFALRMGLIVLAVQLVKGQGWVEVVPLGLTILVAYLGLLFWETRFVSASLAFPGLKPRPAGRTGARRSFVAGRCRAPPVPAQLPSPPSLDARPPSVVLCRRSRPRAGVARPRPSTAGTA